PYGIPSQRQVAATLDRREGAARERDQLFADLPRYDVVVVAVECEQRRGDPGTPRCELVRAGPGRVALGHEHRSGGLPAPTDAVLDRFGRAGFGEALAEEEPEKVIVVVQPVLPVVLRPVLGWVRRHSLY